MKENVRIAFNSGNTSWDQLSKIFNKYNLLELLHEGPSSISMYSFVIPIDSDYLLGLRKEIQLISPTFLERIERNYTNTELQQFPLLWFTLSTAEKGFGGPWFGTRYDLSGACEVCGAGGRQEGPLHLSRREIPKKNQIFQTMGHEYLVNAEIAEALTAAGLKGLELRRAVSEKGERDPLDWWQLIAGYVMPPMSKKLTGFARERPCPHCNRDGWFASNKVPDEPLYDSSSIQLEKLPDAVVTWECFGNSGIKPDFTKSNIAHGLMLVTPKVMDVFRKLKVRSVRFAPVRIE